jgi:preprotein translocase subunit SecD
MTLLSITITPLLLTGIVVFILLSFQYDITLYERIKQRMRKDIKIHEALDSEFTQSVKIFVDHHIILLILWASVFFFGILDIKKFGYLLVLGAIINLTTGHWILYTIDKFMLSIRLIRKI